MHYSYSLQLLNSQSLIYLAYISKQYILRPKMAIKGHNNDIL